MTGQAPSNERGVESSGFVTIEFSDYREKKNSVKGWGWVGLWRWWGGGIEERMSITKTK